jgi:hypothetical protein
MNQEPKTPTREQVAALRRFADREGRQWKAKLRQAWRSGRYPWHVRYSPNDEAYLQQIRNIFGQDWLKNLRLGDLEQST